MGSAENATPKNAPRGQVSDDSVHENKSEVSERLHEIKSDFGKTEPESLHESTSEIRKRLHETESELAERVARRLLEGLRRAAAVR